MGRKKDKQADDRADSEFEFEPAQVVHVEGEDCRTRMTGMEIGGAIDEEEGVLGELGAVGTRRGGDLEVEHGGAKRGDADKGVRDLLLNVSQSMSHITGALQHVVTVLHKNDSDRVDVDVVSGGGQIFAKSVVDLPGGTREGFCREEEMDHRGRRRNNDERAEGRVRERSRTRGYSDGDNGDRPVGSHPIPAQGDRVNVASGGEQIFARSLAGLQRGTRQDTGRGEDRNDGVRRGLADQRAECRARERSATRGDLGGDAGGQPAGGRVIQDQGLNFREQDLIRARYPWQQQGQGAPSNRSLKLPPFNGREEWQVWISRFEIIAHRQRWTQDEKLDNLLPRLEGGAAEFVYSQLPQHVVYDYGLLIGELNNRYRRIETPRTFAAQFSSRNQKNGETAEDYAAELKRLYDRAHGYRDAATRQEDLVRRFLDGLWDEEARFEVEFHKEPTTIDEAVYFIVCFLQTKRRMGEKPVDRHRKPLREARSPSTEAEGLEGSESIGRVPDRAKNANKPGVKGDNPTSIKSSGSEPSKETEKNETAELLKLIMDRLEKITQPNRDKPQPSGDYRRREITCFRCGEKGHMVRECPRGPGNMTCFRCGEEGHTVRECPRGPGNIVRQRGDKPFFHDRQPARGNNFGGSHQNAHLN